MDFGMKGDITPPLTNGHGHGNSAGHEDTNV